MERLYGTPGWNTRRKFAVAIAAVLLIVLVTKLVIEKRTRSAPR